MITHSHQRRHLVILCAASIAAHGSIFASAAQEPLLVSAAAVVDRLAETAGVKERPVDLAITAMRRAAESIDPEQPQRRQPDVIERFFHHTSDILRQIERQPPK